MLSQYDNVRTDTFQPVELKQLRGDEKKDNPHEDGKLEVTPTAEVLLIVGPPPATELTRAGMTRVVLAVSVTGLGWMCVGFNLGYPSPAIPDLNGGPSPYRVSREDHSWVICVSFLGAIVGSLLSGFLADRYGRKITIMLATVPSALCWAMVVSSQNVTMLMAARGLHGVASALFASSSSLYVAETSPPSVRGMLMCSNMVMRSLGILLAYVAGACVRWNWLAVVGLCPVLLLVLLFTLLWETPRWLLMQGRVAAATDSLAWFRAGATPAAIQQELHQIHVGLKSGAYRKPAPWRDFLRPPLLQVLGVSQGLALVFSLTGMHLVIMFTVTIFQFAGSELDPYMQTVAIGVAMLVVSVVCCLVIDRFPRRVMLISALVAMSVGWLAMGAFFLVLDWDPAYALDRLYWLPVAALVLVVVGINLGVFSLPIIVTNEIFPTRARGRAMGLYVFTSSVSSAFGTYFFLRLEASVGSCVTFWLCAALCVVGVIFVYVCVPETKGKSLEKVQRQLKMQTP